jgi:hypothetical protein
MRTPAWVRALLGRAVPSPVAGLGPHERAVLTNIWRHADRAGVAYLASEAIAAETGLTRWTVIRQLPRLEAVGALRIERGGGRSRTNTYHVAPEWIMALRLAQARNCAPGARKRAAGGAAP